MRYDADVLRAIKQKSRPYRAGDIAMATHLSFDVIQRSIRDLRSIGLIHATWVGERGPFYELGEDPLKGPR